MNRFSLGSRLAFPRACKVAKNRAVLAPITHNMSADNGNLSDNELAWLTLCGQGGFGMLITAATQVGAGGRCWAGQPALFNDHQQAQFSNIANMAKQCGALSIVQLHHGGVRAHPSLNSTPPVGPSALPVSARHPNGVTQMSADDIDAMVAAFSDAAVRAYRAGMDGIELHAAHNFLLCNFLNPELNTRQDAWGGSVQKRTKLLRDIIGRIRRNAPRDFMIGVRLSPESYANITGIELAHQITVANILIKCDIDYIHFSMGDTFKLAEQHTEHAVTTLSLIRAGIDTSVPLMVAGHINDETEVNRAFDLGADVVAIGTSALGNPDWPLRVLGRSELHRAPFSEAHLYQQGFNAKAMTYLRGLAGVVATQSVLEGH